MPWQRVMEGIWTTCPSRGRRKRQGHPYKSPRTRNCLKRMSTVQRRNQGENSSFETDITTALSYLKKEGGTHCWRLNGLVRKILLRCYDDRMTICIEYLCGVANLRADTLFRRKEAQKWYLRTPAYQRLFKWWVTPVDDVFMCPSTTIKTAHKRRPCEEMPWRWNGHKTWDMPFQSQKNTASPRKAGKWEGDWSFSHPFGQTTVGSQK